ncbi:MAG: type II toxin-antitoxin system Phd/YefM family antitoxin, partial [Methanomassiliicoccaceae archaeon]|nr:type II toxin-antitoxin system Phd/YefM family antitoxin [Methanomassiliicoccaceae archaeon]
KGATMVKNSESLAGGQYGKRSGQGHTVSEQGSTDPGAVRVPSYCMNHKAYIYMYRPLSTFMKVINITQARRDLFGVMESVLNGRMLTITSKNGNAVLISEEEWNEIMETLYVLSDPDTLPAIIEADATPTSELESIDWRNII